MRNYLYFTIFFAGMTALAAEFAASRLIQMSFSQINIVWAVVIGLVLLYFALGYFFGGRWADASPKPATLYTILAVGGVSLAIIPLLAQSVLRMAAQATDALDLGLMAGAFIAVLVLFSLPITLLAMTSPFALRLLLDDTRNAGNVSGRVSALSTAGSVLGAFLPNLFLFNTLGANRTILLFGILMLLVALIGLWLSSNARRAGAFLLLLPFLIGLFIWGDFHVKKTQGQIFETESEYNYIEVIERNQYRYLRLNDGQGVHSQYHPTEMFYGGPWEQFLVGPFFNPAPFEISDVERIAVVGLAAGTTARQATAIFGPIPIDGYEIDAKIVQAGRDYFGMDMPNLNVHITDGRWGISHSAYTYNLIIVDAYRPPYIPPHLTTREFFQATFDRLDPQNGVLAINIGRTPSDRRLINDLAATIGSVYPSIYVMDIPNTFNSILYATRQPTRVENLAHNMSRLFESPSTPRLLLRAGSTTMDYMAAAPSGGTIYTDDLTPVEWVTNDMILTFLMGGGAEMFH